MGLIHWSLNITGYSHARRSSLVYRGSSLAPMRYQRRVGVMHEARCLVTAVHSLVQYAICGNTPHACHLATGA